MRSRLALFHRSFKQAAALTGCISVAATIDDIRAMLTAAGVIDIDIRLIAQSTDVVGSWLAGAERFVASATIEARKGG